MYDNVAALVFGALLQIATDQHAVAFVTRVGTRSYLAVNVTAHASKLEHATGMSMRHIRRVVSDMCADRVMSARNGCGGRPPVYTLYLAWLASDARGLVRIHVRIDSETAETTPLRNLCGHRYGHRYGHDELQRVRAHMYTRTRTRARAVTSFLKVSPDVSKPPRAKDLEDFSILPPPDGDPRQDTRARTCARPRNASHAHARRPADGGHSQERKMGEEKRPPNAGTPCPQRAPHAGGGRVQAVQNPAAPGRGQDARRFATTAALSVGNGGSGELRRRPEPKLPDWLEAAVGGDERPPMRKCAPATDHAQKELDSGDPLRMSPVLSALLAEHRGLVDLGCHRGKPLEFFVNKILQRTPKHHMLPTLRAAISAVALRVESAEAAGNSTSTHQALVMLVTFLDQQVTRDANKRREEEARAPMTYKSAKLPVKPEQPPDPGDIRNRITSLQRAISTAADSVIQRKKQ